MQVQLRTDAHVSGHESLARAVEVTITDALAHLAARISRVEVHLADENGAKGGPEDLRCTMEARLEGHAPVVVTFHASSLQEAIDGGASRLRHALDSAFGKLDEHDRAHLAGRLHR